MKRSDFFPLLLVCALGVGCWYLGNLMIEGTKPSGERDEPSQATTETVYPERTKSVPVIESPALALLNDPSRSPVEDVRLLEGLIDDYLLMAKGNRRPIGLNEEVVLALTEPGRFGVRFMSPANLAISEGLLLDRWGQPYHVHAVRPDELEVRSPGPDQTLFTSDDILNRDDEPSLAGL